MAAIRLIILGNVTKWRVGIRFKNKAIFTALFTEKTLQTKEIYELSLQYVEPC